MSRVIKAEKSKSPTNHPHSILVQPVGTERSKDDKEETKTKESAKQQLLVSAREQADAMITEARAESEKIYREMETSRAEFENKIEEQYKEAWTKGEREGYLTGKRKGYETYQKTIAEATHVVEAAKEDYQQYLNAAEPVIIDLAIMLTKKILGEKLEMEDHWLQFIKEALQEVKNHTEVVVYIHPDRYKETVQQREEWQALLTHAEHLRFIPDTNLDNNGCVFETPVGRLAVSLEDQLGTLHTELHDLLASGRS
ncbi:flagellar assembly protein FliH [Geomicrobium halophilum]|uniref:Flagellar assembly protein FliH n=1 Tax=Geomicrobium halophilum TaxID=549000 RepID=A0A841PKN3_9BACL|nr:flagellar assembly protein FliH [Geomicrobium halophilum]MBB6449299.1 flagellar assembly protein FliH [Geomicrobium halophilum]